MGIASSKKKTYAVFLGVTDRYAVLDGWLVGVCDEYWGYLRHLHRVLNLLRGSEERRAAVEIPYKDEELSR